jgi:hypothetical protein
VAGKIAEKQFSLLFFVPFVFSHPCIGFLLRYLTLNGNNLNYCYNKFRYVFVDTDTTL